MEIANDLLLENFNLDNDNELTEIFEPIGDVVAAKSA